MFAFDEKSLFNEARICYNQINTKNSGGKICKEM